MNNLSKPFSLADLVALQAENQTAQANLKKVTEIKLDQIELFEKPQPHGGNRSGSGRKSAPEKTTVVRVPVGCLAEVHQLIAEYRNPNLKTVTEIKLPVDHLKTVTEIKLPDQEPAFRVRQVIPRYRLVVDGVERLWSGRGRLPVEYQEYAQKHGYQGRDYLQALLIEGAEK